MKFDLFNYIFKCRLGKNHYCSMKSLEDLLDNKIGVKTTCPECNTPMIISVADDGHKILTFEIP